MILGSKGYELTGTVKWDASEFFLRFVDRPIKLDVELVQKMPAETARRIYGLPELMAMPIVPAPEPPWNFHEWLDPAIWKEDHRDFWNAQRGEYDRRKGLNTNRPLEPFLLFRSRHSHELAHFIVCDDRDLFDPWWGVSTWTFANGDDAMFDDDDLMIEAEVLAIDYFLRGRDPSGHDGPVARELLRHANLRGIGSIRTPDDDESLRREVETGALIAWLVDAIKAKWGGLDVRDPHPSRRLLWAECVRKTNLVRRCYSMRGTWPR